MFHFEPTSTPHYQISENMISDSLMEIKTIDDVSISEELIELWKCVKKV